MGRKLCASFLAIWSLFTWGHSIKSTSIAVVLVWHKTCVNNLDHFKWCVHFSGEEYLLFNDVLVCLKIFSSFYLKGRHTQKDIFHLLVHCLNICNSKGWAQQKPGTRIQYECLWWPKFLSWLLHSRRHWQETGIIPRGGIWTRHSYRVCGSPKQHLNSHIKCLPVWSMND